MRLTEEEVIAIKAAAQHAFGSDATVRLFGSRLDDGRVGGDIDLHIESSFVPDEFAAKLRFEEYLFARIDEQKVDVVVTQRQGKSPSGFERIAYRDGVVL